MSLEFPLQNIFLKAEDLGVLEPQLKQAIGSGTKRSRAAQFRKVIGLLKALGLLAGPAPITGLAQGINSLGDRGWWVTLEPYRTLDVQEGAMPRRSTAAKLQGELSPEEFAKLPRAEIPRTAAGRPPEWMKSLSHKFHPDGQTEYCATCGLHNLDIVHEPPHDK